MLIAKLVALCVYVGLSFHFHAGETHIICEWNLQIRRGG